MINTILPAGVSGFFPLHAMLSVVAREASQFGGVLPPAGGQSTAYVGIGLLLAGGLTMVSGGMWWMFRLVTSSGRAPLPTTSQANRSGTPVDQLSLQRPQVPRRRAESARASREITPFRPGAVTAHHPAFIQLYYALEARRTDTMPFVVHFVSPSPHAGVSTVTSGYARVAADAASRPVLFVDASYRPEITATGLGETPTLVDAFASNMPLASAIVPARNARNLLWTRLYDSPDSLLSLGTDRLHDLLDMLRTQHSLVVLDCASLMLPQAAAVSRYCDGSVLVVAAGITTQLEINAAHRHIEQLGGQVIGLVLNRERGRASRRAEFA
jgi:Mrp family chromosome partitioning ATPase